MTLQQQLDAINEKIAAARAEKTASAKAFKKLQNCKVKHNNMHKYVSLQELYMNTIRGQ